MPAAPALALHFPIATDPADTVSSKVGGLLGDSLRHIAILLCFLPTADLWAAGRRSCAQTIAAAWRTRLELVELEGRDVPTASLFALEATLPVPPAPTAAVVLETLAAVAVSVTFEDDGMGHSRLVATVQSDRGIPSGIVEFSEDGRPVGRATVDATGHAKLEVPTVANGTTIVATFLGSDRFAPATSPKLVVSRTNNNNNNNNTSTRPTALSFAPAVISLFRSPSIGGGGGGGGGGSGPALVESPGLFLPNTGDLVEGWDLFDEHRFWRNEDNLLELDEPLLDWIEEKADENADSEWLHFGKEGDEATLEDAEKALGGKAFVFPAPAKRRDAPAAKHAAAKSSDASFSGGESKSDGSEGEDEGGEGSGEGGGDA